MDRKFSKKKKSNFFEMKRNLSVMNENEHKKDQKRRKEKNSQKVNTQTQKRKWTIKGKWEDE